MQAGLKHRDLGEIAGPALVFGGPYSNLQATRALLAEAGRRGIGPEAMICTGDVVAYAADGPATLDAIRASGCTVVAGNCEKQLAAGAADCGCGFDAGSTCDVLSAGWYGHAARTVGTQDREWMGQCPDIVTFRHAGQRCAVIHGGLSDISRFLWPTSSELDFSDEITQISKVVGPVDTVLSGHSGIAFVRDIGPVTWINAGVIRMPPHDGRSATRYTILTDGRAVIHRLDYDHAAAARAMVEEGLVQGYQTALSTGVWPSEDVLPTEMRR